LTYSSQLFLRRVATRAREAAITIDHKDLTITWNSSKTHPTRLRVERRRKRTIAWNKASLRLEYGNIADAKSI